MIELTYTGEAQEVLLNAPVLFNNVVVHSGCCERHRSGSGQITLTKAGRYLITFSGNIAVPTDGVTGEINLGITLDGDVLNGSIMRVNTGVDEYMNVSTQHYVDVYCGCCQTVSVRALEAPVSVLNANITAVRVA